MRLSGSRGSFPSLEISHMIISRNPHPSLTQPKGSRAHCASVGVQGDSSSSSWICSWGFGLPPLPLSPWGGNDRRLAYVPSYHRELPSQSGKASCEQWRVIAKRFFFFCERATLLEYLMRKSFDMKETAIQTDVSQKTIFKYALRLRGGKRCRRPGCPSRQREQNSDNACSINGKTCLFR